MAKLSTSWPVAEAKSRFSEVIDCAIESGPQTITRNGKVTAVLVSFDEWERRTRRKGTLADFFAASPLRGSGVRLDRSDELPRKIDL